MHKGFAFVQFTNPFDARSACVGEDARTVLGQTLGNYYDIITIEYTHIVIVVPFKWHDHGYCIYFISFFFVCYFHRFYCLTFLFALGVWKNKKRLSNIESG